MTILVANTTSPRTGGASFSIGHRISRALWQIVWSTLGSWTPVPMHGWRRTLLRLFGAKMASTAKVYPKVKVWYQRNLEMAEYSCIGPGVNCYCMDKVVLGPYALVSQGAHLCGGTHDVDDPSFQLQARPIVVGGEAWIAAEAFVGPGIIVGDGAVLGARAVSMKDLEPWTIYVGNPARPLRSRRRTSEGGSCG